MVLPLLTRDGFGLRNFEMDARQRDEMDMLDGSVAVVASLAVAGLSGMAHDSL